MHDWVFVCKSFYASHFKAENLSKVTEDKKGEEVSEAASSWLTHCWRKLSTLN